MSIFISRPQLWEKLIERRKENIASGIDAFHVNMGINQTIGIMNGMVAYELPPCPNCGEQSEMAYMLSFARTQDFFYELTRKQLRSLWTAYCIRHDYEPDTEEYNNDLQWIWQAILENDSYKVYDKDIGFEKFYVYMVEEVL